MELTIKRRLARVPPCRRCGSYNTLGAPSGPSITCSDCRHEYNVYQQDAESLWGHLGRHHRHLSWLPSAGDPFGNEFALTGDPCMGRRWVLWINVGGFGHWLVYGGSFWFQWSARAAAQWFSRRSGETEGAAEFQEWMRNSYHLPPEITFPLRIAGSDGRR